MDKKEYKISEEFVGLRLDKAISMKDSSLSRVAVQRMIDEENILVNGKATKTSYKLKNNDIVEYSFEIENVLTKDILDKLPTEEDLNIHIDIKV